MITLRRKDPQMVREKEFKVVCIGDSFTVGPMVDADRIWASILDRDLPGYRFLNRGISGDTTSGMLARLRSDVIDESPHYAIITGGANDLICMGKPCKGNGPSESDPPMRLEGDPSILIKNNYMAMIHQLFANRIKPIIATPIPCISEMIPKDWSEFYDFSKLNDTLCELNKWQIAFSRSFLCSCLDIYTPLAELIDSDRELGRTYFTDGLHLSEAGHEYIAGIMKAQLEGILR